MNVKIMIEMMEVVAITYFLGDVGNFCDFNYKQAKTHHKVESHNLNSLPKEAKRQLIP